MLARQNRAKYDSLKKKFLKRKSHASAQKLFKFVSKNPCGLYRLNEVEEYYEELAEATNTVTDMADPVAGSFLHVMTECYLNGGHTRVVERWIEAASTEESHSVILLSQKDQSNIPKRLEQQVLEKGGKLLQLNSQFLVDKANELRTIALSYQYIVLHHHPNDPVPLMAFSLEKFRTRIMTFNHAGHLPWLGANVGEITICHESQQEQIAYYIRGCKQTTLVNLILDNSDKDLLETGNKSHIEDLTLIAMAPESKFAPIKGYNFHNDLATILSSHPNVKFVGVGMDTTNLDWADLKNEFPDQIDLQGSLPYEKVKAELRKADVYLDSFPSTSWTAILDAISVANLPVLTRASMFGSMPFMEDCRAVCTTREIWLSKLEKLLNSKSDRDELAADLKLRCLENCTAEVFRRHIEEVCSNWGNWNFNKPSVYSEKEVLGYDEFRCMIANSVFGEGRVSRFKARIMKSLRKKINIKSHGK